MSIYRNSVESFVDVIETDLISGKDLAELEQLVSQLPEEDEEISKAIENWLQPESRSQILQAYEERLEALIDASDIDIDKNLGLAGSRSHTQPNQPNRGRSPVSKVLLLNAIQRRRRKSTSSNISSDKS